MVEHLGQSGVDPRYAGFFECFNRQEFFDAHEVLEDLWLEERGPRPKSNYSFHKGLIQLAGAFLHLQKGRLRPAAALFRLCDANLANYPTRHERLDVAAVRLMIADWLRALEATNYGANPWPAKGVPNLNLESTISAGPT